MAIEQKIRILISGAGVAGPVLAHFLARTGRFQLTILEKAPKMLTEGQNIDIEGTALNIVNKMGLLEAIRKNSTTETGTCFVDSRGKRFADLPLRGGAGSPTSEYEILRGDLVQVLYEATKDKQDIEYRFGTTVDQVLENRQDRVKVKLSSGDVEEFDLLVASDGQWSRIRKEVFAPQDITVVDKNAFCVYFTAPKKEGEDDSYWQIYHGLNSRVVSTRPDPYGTTRAFFSIMPLDSAQASVWTKAARSHDRKIQIDLVRSEFANVGWKTPRLLTAMEEAEDLYFQAIQQIRMKKWSKNRIICLGDTAYAPTPFTGMGTSLAINGAYLLAGHLSQLHPSQHPKQALEAYETEFRPFVEKIQDTPWFVPGIMHPRTAWKRWLLQSFLSLVASVVRNPLIVRWSQGKKEENFGEGLVSEIDAPFPKFEHFEKA